MKNIKFLILLMVSLISFNSCLDDDSELTFVADPQGDFTFSNTFLAEYILTPETSSNLGERFTWNDANFGVETNINYELQRSILGDFSDMEIVGSTSENSYSITIGDMIGYAIEAGLDNDSGTPNPDRGDIAFRVRASVGTSGETDILSETNILTMYLPEASSGGPVCDLDQLWAVGAGLPDAGWGWTTPVSLACLANGTYAWNVNLLNSETFRFFTTEGDWASGLNYPHYDGEGYTIDSNFEDALDGDNNFRFTGMTGFYYLEVDTVAKTITLNDPQPTGVCDLDQLWAVGAGLPDAGWGWTTPIQFLCTGEGVYSGSANLLNGESFRFFTSEGDWASGLNYPYYSGEGYTIDSNFEDAMDGDNNFRFTGTTGSYFFTIDTVGKVISIE